MFGQIFAAIQLILKLIGLWEQFSEWTIKKSIADREERRQKRDKAIEDQKKAKDEEEFNRLQDEITRNRPRP